MKTLLIAVAAAGLVGLPADAAGQFDDTPNQLGIFFDLDLTAPVTNTDVLGWPVTMYAVLVNGPIEGIRGFELKLELRDGCIGYMINYALDPVAGIIYPPYGYNLVIPYPAVQPYDPSLGGMLLVTWSMMFVTGGGIYLGPSYPSSVQGQGPAIWTSPELPIIVCTYVVGADAAGPDNFARVATVLGEGVMATGARSLSGVKALFR